MSDWTLADTNTHQDYVIAHVMGATVLGYFVFDETAFLLLDIGFIWHLYLDGEMGLRPAFVAISELEADPNTKAKLQNEVDAALLGGELHGPTLFKSLFPTSPVRAIDFFVHENSRRFLLTCESGGIVIETSLTTCEVRVNVRERM